MTERQKFSLSLPGLQKVLAEHIYSSKRVAARELFQNAHDSCVRRRLEEHDPHYQARIEVRADPGRRVLTIHDNGSGLTRQELVEYLGTVGRGYTRELRERLALEAGGDDSELIGQFGLGFLSAFLVASEVTVTTRSFRGGEACRFHSAGGEDYELAPACRADVGTAVELRLKPAGTFLLDESTLAETVRRYCDFLPTPIYLQDEPFPVNAMAPPWQAADPAAAGREYLKRTFGEGDPLWVMPLTDWAIDLGHDSVTVPLRGFLFVPSGSVASLREYGDVRVYIRRMFICEREPSLLPPWARFVRGVLECPTLQPTASREGVHQDGGFDLVRQALERHLSANLKRLARQRPETWKRIVRAHSDVIVGWAVKDEGFFEQVEDLVALRTSRGLLTLPEFLRLSGGTLYHVTRDLGSLQDRVLAEGRNVPAIDASWFAVQPFLDKYVSRHPEVASLQLDGESEQLFRPVPEAPFRSLVEHYERREIRAVPAAFRPSEVPAVILYPKNADLLLEAGKAVEAGDLPGGLAGLVREYVGRHGADDLRGTLYLNASCPLVRRLAAGDGGAAFGAALTLLYAVARLFSGRMLSAANAVEAFRQTTQAIEELLP